MYWCGLEPLVAEPQRDRCLLDASLYVLGGQL
jgi:hypothetical protein